MVSLCNGAMGWTCTTHFHRWTLCWCYSGQVRWTMMRHPQEEQCVYIFIKCLRLPQCFTKVNSCKRKNQIKIRVKAFLCSFSLSVHNTQSTVNVPYLFSLNENSSHRLTLGSVGRTNWACSHSLGTKSSTIYEVTNFVIC